MQRVGALKNLFDYRLSVISYAPGNYGRADYTRLTICAKAPTMRGLCVICRLGELDGVFEGFDRAGFDDLALRPGFEHGLLFREGIDAFTLRHGGLRDR